MITEIDLDKKLTARNPYTAVRLITHNADFSLFIASNFEMRKMEDINKVNVIHEFLPDDSGKRMEFLEITMDLFQS